MVMTILEARVTIENWPALEQAFQQGAQYHDAGLEQSFLIHGIKDPDLWRILTVWESREALDKMRSSGETPRGVLMFRSANAEPTLSIFEISHHISQLG
jgi:heme-degrading monooxygenase HmoA